MPSVRLIWIQKKSARKQADTLVCNLLMTAMFLKEYQEFSGRLSTIHSDKISISAKKFVFEVLIRIGFKVLLDGYSRFKRLSNEAIGQLMLDVKSIQIGLEGLCAQAGCPMKPLPMSSALSEFIRALYCKEEELEAFIQSSQELDSKYLVSIVNIVTANTLNKKLKQKLLSIAGEKNKLK